MKYQTIETEAADGLFVIRQNRPAALNARTGQMYLEIEAALADAEADPSVVAVLLSGRGRFFCAGADLKSTDEEMRSVRSDDAPAVAALKRALPAYSLSDCETWLSTRFVLAFVAFSKPIFAAVNGPAIGEGFSCLLHCDVVYAADGTYFWAPFARAGVVPEFCSTLLMPRRLGASLGRAALYLGRKITVEEAHRVGFVTDIIAAGDGFESAVRAHILEGLELAGPPEMRAQTLRVFRALAYADADRKVLADQCIKEMSAIARRQVSGETAAVREYYSAMLPSAKKT